jgi:hypothetical protein
MHRSSGFSGSTAHALERHVRLGRGQPGDGLQGPRDRKGTSPTVVAQRVPSMAPRHRCLVVPCSATRTWIGSGSGGLPPKETVRCFAVSPKGCSPPENTVGNAGNSGNLPPISSCGLHRRLQCMHRCRAEAERCCMRQAKRGRSVRTTVTRRHHCKPKALSRLLFAGGTRLGGFGGTPRCLPCRCRARSGRGPTGYGAVANDVTSSRASLHPASSGHPEHPERPNRPVL